MPRSQAGLRRPALVTLTLTSVVGAIALTGSIAAQAQNEVTEPRQEPQQLEQLQQLDAKASQLDGAGTYIVQLKGQPVAAYDGGISGYQATRPMAGESIDPNDSKVERYRGYLENRRASVLRTVPGAETLYDYDAAFNGFSAELTAKEATTLAHNDDVVYLWKNEMRKVDTVSTPDFLGLTGEKGVWNKQFEGQEKAGEGVIVGVVDTGIWPENPSFDALPTPRPDADIIEKKWNGTCNAGDDPNPANNIECNNKLLGADYFDKGVNPIKEEFESPRDYGGHGSHTSSTAAGNGNVEAVINGESVGNVSGMAPAARLAMYKACWETSGDDGGCASVDLVAAIDQAVADGVDVINYSISGSLDFVVSADEIAFYNAARAGVFVSTSAGNEGPGASTVAHNSPWTTTVAASSHDRGFRATTTLGDGTEITGAGLGSAVPESALVLSSDVPAGGANQADARLCVPGSLAKAEVNGKVVACARGTIARTDKSLAVKQAGGVGMILYNTEAAADDTAADFHYVPTVHVSMKYMEAIETYAGSADATAALSASEPYEKRAPEMASFSSAGPALAGGGDLLKPDITAPGVDVIAAVAPPGNADQNFASYQGTSMSSPHVAGLGALLRSKHQNWTPSRIKSALMTTATTTDNLGKSIQRAGQPATPFDLGAGHVVPKRAFAPGLAYESGPADWIAYMCAIDQGQLVGAPCDEVPQIDPSDLNYPSIAIGDLAGEQTVTRTVTNTTDAPGVYRANVDEPAGTDVSVSPQLLALKPGQSKEVSVTITRTDAKFGAYMSGSLTWEGFGGSSSLTSVRSPIVVRPVELSAPDEVTGKGATGSKNLELTAGYDGTLNATAGGLVADTVKTLPLSNPTGASFPTDNPQTNDHVAKVSVDVPAGGAEAVRFATFDSDYADLGEGTDVDLYVYERSSSGLEYLGASAAGGSDESVTLTGAGTYEVYVDLWALPSGVTKADVLHHHWVVSGAEDNLEVSPASQDVALGGTATIKASWNGLKEGTRYVGTVSYDDGEKPLGLSVLSITG